MAIYSMLKVNCFTLNMFSYIICLKKEPQRMKDQTGKGEGSVNIGKQILSIRKEKQLTQEEFGRLFHVTRQTVSNWENEKSYPDLQMLVDMSDQFGISLDVLLKEDSKMVKTIDKERMHSKIKHARSIIDIFSGAGTGIIVSCLISPDSIRRTIAVFVGLILVGISWYKKSEYDKEIIRYMEEQ